jgi:hypothetical protein
MQSKECEAQAQEEEGDAMTTEEMAKKLRQEFSGLGYISPPWEYSTDQSDWLRVAAFVESEIKKAKLEMLGNCHWKKLAVHASHPGESVEATIKKAKRETLQAVDKQFRAEMTMCGSFDEWLKREIEAIK